MSYLHFQPHWNQIPTKVGICVVVDSLITVKEMAQLLYFWWQWLPGEWVIHEAEMRQISGILRICFGSLTPGFRPSPGIQWIGQTHPPSRLVGEVSKGLLIATRRLHYQMDHNGVNILTPFFYLSLYSLESLVIIGKFSYEDRFVRILIPICHIQSFFH